MVIKDFRSYLYKNTSILPLVIFRMAFGFLMAFSMLRFIYNGWIEDCYITPEFHFTYQYFKWIKPFDVNGMYTVVILCAIAAFCIGLGFLYRVSTILFFLTFTYLELIEKSWYLNHYYFVSLVAFLLILAPAHKNFSIDAKLKLTSILKSVPSWTVIIFKLQLCIVYFFGGLAKLKSDWLLEAQPLKIWLRARTDMPVLGWFFEYDITPFLFSWSGMLYDLTIPFLLWSRKTRLIAYILVVIFHVLTYALFNIGMFPWLMMFGSLVFITHAEWGKIFSALNFKLSFNGLSNYNTKPIILPFLILFFVFQSLFPLRHFLLTDNVLWTENGFRFSWHVMIMEKNGFTEFIVVDNKSNKRWKAYPSNKLTTIQEKQMSFQPDMIWQYAQFLKEDYKTKGYSDISIYVNSKVSLNGRTSKRFINENSNLLEIKDVNDIYNHVLE